MAETNGQVVRRRVGGEAVDTGGIDPAPQKAPPKVARDKAGPEKVTSTTHVNVALPFAKLEVHEPSEHLLALTYLVRDLAGLLARTASGPEVDALVKRADKLVAEIR